MRSLTIAIFKSFFIYSYCFKYFIFKEIYEKDLTGFNKFKIITLNWVRISKTNGKIDCFNVSFSRFKGPLFYFFYKLSIIHSNVVKYIFK